MTLSNCWAVCARSRTALEARSIGKLRGFADVLHRAYPQISEAISSEMLSAGFAQMQLPIFRSVTGKSSAKQDDEEKPLSGKVLLSRLSFTHLELLSSMEDPLKRAFYELECIKGNWSVRELKRQVGSLYFERSGLSRDPAQLFVLANAATLQADPAHIIRDPYVFEFLGFRPSEVLPESGRILD